MVFEGQLCSKATLLGLCLMPVCQSGTPTQLWTCSVPINAGFEALCHSQELAFEGELGPVSQPLSPVARHWPDLHAYVVLSCQGTATFKSRDSGMVVSTQTLRSNASITVLPEVVHNVSIFHL